MRRSCRGICRPLRSAIQRTRRSRRSPRPPCVPRRSTPSACASGRPCSRQRASRFRAFRLPASRCRTEFRRSWPPRSLRQIPCVPRRGRYRRQISAAPVSDTMPRRCSRARRSFSRPHGRKSMPPRRRWRSAPRPAHSGSWRTSAARSRRIFQRSRRAGACPPAAWRPLRKHAAHRRFCPSRTAPRFRSPGHIEVPAPALSHRLPAPRRSSPPDVPASALRQPCAPRHRSRCAPARLRHAYGCAPMRSWSGLHPA